MLAKEADTSDIGHSMSFRIEVEEVVGRTSEDDVEVDNNLALILIKIILTILHFLQLFMNFS